MMDAWLHRQCPNPGQFFGEGKEGRNGNGNSGRIFTLDVTDFRFITEGDIATFYGNWEAAVNQGKSTG